MYAWLWHRLPEPRWLRVAIALLLVLGAIALLMGVVFPWVDGIWSMDDPSFPLELWPKKN
jgi:hypothetical protein